MLSFFKRSVPRALIFFYNTLSKTKEEFKPLSGRSVKMYTCGPTVYDYSHVGNLRAAVFPDLVRRILEYAGFEVKAVMNITDFGHLSGEREDTEDKMTLALKREGKELTLENMKLIGEFYTESFMNDVKELNIELPFALPRASDHIAEQIAFVSTLLEKGYAYKISDGIYFDISKFPAYGGLGLSRQAGASAFTEHSRVGVNPEKHDQRDFALWKYNADIGWESPWGRGFPGWHIECAAMATKYLGKSFDIHAGGIDLAPIHHNNEIAEAESASGKKYAHYWLHNEFLTIDGQKISKSLGNTITLTQLKDRGISPLSFRYWLLTAHYRQSVNFTWEALLGAQTALQRAQRIFVDLPEGGKISLHYRSKFETALYDDVNTPEAVAVMWELLKDAAVSAEDIRETILDFDRVLGLGFGKVNFAEFSKLNVIAKKDIPEDIERLIKEREKARNAKEWDRADQLRVDIEEHGFTVEDTKEGPTVRKI